MLEIFVQRPKEDVDWAIVQFAARRSYRLSQPWYIEGVRLEAPGPSRDIGVTRGFWATLFIAQSLPRIDVETKRRRSGTRIRLNIGDTPDSTRLAYELHAYLLDERSYDRQIPPICRRCSNPIANITARYCGRCGHHLIVDNKPTLRSSEKLPQILEPPPIPAPRPEHPLVSIEPAAPLEEEEMERSFERREPEPVKEPAGSAEIPAAADEQSANIDAETTNTPIESEEADSDSPPDASVRETEPLAEAESEADSEMDEDRPPEKPSQERRALAEE